MVNISFFYTIDVYVNIIGDVKLTLIFARFRHTEHAQTSSSKYKTESFLDEKFASRQYLRMKTYAFQPPVVQWRFIRALKKIEASAWVFGVHFHIKSPCRWIVVRLWSYGRIATKLTVLENDEPCSEITHGTEHWWANTTCGLFQTLNQQVLNFFPHASMPIARSRYCIDKIFVVGKIESKFANILQI